MFCMKHKLVTFKMVDRMFSVNVINNLYLTYNFRGKNNNAPNKNAY